MSITISIDLPEQAGKEFLDLWDQAALSRKVLEALVVEAYREGRISRGKVGEILGMGFHQREAFLRDRDVPYNYDQDDLQEDVETVARLSDKPL